MARMVQCVKLGREAEGLEKQPIKGELGQRVFENVSKEAWKHVARALEDAHQRVPPRPASASPGQRMWMTELEKYFFGEGAQLPAEFVPPKTK